jgi:hypothetical protein
MPVAAHQLEMTMFNRKPQDVDSELHTWKDPLVEQPRSYWWLLPVIALIAVIGFAIARFNVLSDWMVEKMEPSTVPVVKNEHVTAQPKFGELPPSSAAARKDSRTFESTGAPTELPDVPLLPGQGQNHWAIVEMPTGETRVAITDTPIYVRMKAMAEACVGAPNLGAAKVGFRGRDERAIMQSSVLPEREICFRTLDEPYIEIALDKSTLALQIGLERSLPYVAARKLDAPTLKLAPPPTLAGR